MEKEILIPAAFLVWMPYDTPTAEDIRSCHEELTIPAAPYHGQASAEGAIRSLTRSS